MTWYTDDFCSLIGFVSFERRHRVLPTPRLFRWYMATESEVASFLDRQTTLLQRERDAEIEQTALLLSSCGFKLLERKGLALGALGVASMQIGLGGKRSESLIANERFGPSFPTIRFQSRRVRTSLGVPHVAALPFTYSSSW